MKTGDTVKVYYTVSLPGATPFESNRNATPLEFTLGAGMVVPGFEEAILGLSPGQTRTITVPAEKAYGPYKEELKYIASTSEVKVKSEKLIETNNLWELSVPGLEPVYVWKKPNGEMGYFRLSNVTQEMTTVDENHPFAGKDLVFEITLVEIVEKTGQ